MTSKDLLVFQDSNISNHTNVKFNRIVNALTNFGTIAEMDYGDLAHIAKSLECALTNSAKCCLTIAKLCAHLKRLLAKKSTSEIAALLALEVPELVRSASWMTRLIKAGEILTQWPQLEDIANIDKLAILWRIPKKLQREIFDSGVLPDGRDFRSLSRGELAEAVGSLRSPGQNSVPPNPYRQARQKLIKLVADFGPLCESFAGLPGYSAIVEQVQGMQKRLIKIVEETAVTPRVHVLPGPISQQNT